MTPFALEEAAGIAATLDRFRNAMAGAAPEARAIAYIAGGAGLVDLMKLEVIAPETLVNLRPLRPALRMITRDDTHLAIGAMATMSEVMAHPLVDQSAPLIPQTLRQAASPQLRNAATLAGNLLQRTRCSYFRDRHSACNKRAPGSGCAAIGGDSRGLAILGTSPHCIANFPGDLAVSLVALEASLEVLGLDGTRRTLPVADLHRLPGDRPDLETVLAPGDLITGLRVPLHPWTGTAYVKVRDRASYAFALASAAVALRREADGTIAEARVVLGGLASKPWRCHAIEAFLVGRQPDETALRQAPEHDFANARLDEPQAFKLDLARRTILRAVIDAGGP